MTDEKKPAQGAVKPKLYAGVDVMADRLEAEIYAFEPQQKRVAVLTLWVDPAQNEAWRLLHTLLCAYPGLQAAGIDSGGHYTAQVYRFAQASGLPGSGAAHRVFATKTHPVHGQGNRIVLVDVSGLDGQIELLLVDVNDDAAYSDMLKCAAAVYEWESAIGRSSAAMPLGQRADDGLGLLLEAAPSAELAEVLGLLRQMAVDVSFLANLQRRSEAAARSLVHVSKVEGPR